MSERISITYAHMTKAAHAIGCSAYSANPFPTEHYRNRYVCSPCDEWEDMCQAGLAVTRKAPGFCGEDSVVYSLNDRGIEVTHAFLCTALRDRKAFCVEVEP